MGRRSLLAAALWSLCLVASCFRPKDRCELPCDPAKKGADCPGSMTCLTTFHLCGLRGDVCYGVDAASDPGMSLPPPDAPIDTGPVERPPTMAVVDAGTETTPEIPPDHPIDNPVQPNDGGVRPEVPPEVPPSIPEPPPDGRDGPDGEEPPPPELPDGDAMGMRPDGDGGETPDGDSGVTPPQNCHDLETEPPTMSCWNGHCLQLTQTMQDGSLLWLDPSNLGAVGSLTTTWCDQSGAQNDAIARFPGAFPTVTANGGLMLAYGQPGAGLVVPEYPTLDLGTGDFTILMVVGFNHGGVGKTFFLKQSPQSPFPTQIVMEWMIATPPSFSFLGLVNATKLVSSSPTDPGVERVYGLRRVGDSLQLRVNGNIVNTNTLTTPGASTDSSGDLYLGSRGGLDPETVDTIRAVIMISGSLTDDEVGALESWLRTAFGIS